MMIRTEIEPTTQCLVAQYRAVIVIDWVMRIYCDKAKRLC
jgi:hypothetical protein